MTSKVKPVEPGWGTMLIVFFLTLAGLFLSIGAVVWSWSWMVNQF